MTPSRLGWSTLLVVCLAACREPAVEAPPAPKPVAKPKPTAVAFADVATSAGIAFHHETGATGQKYMPETMGSGVAIFDADGDGRLDLYFVNGRSWDRSKPATSGRLYLQRGDGGALRYQDATKGSGLDVSLYGMGALAFDADGDGRDDLLVTALDDVRLFRNLGGGRFADTTRMSGLPSAGWWTAAVAFDFDLDGDLDLFLGRYVDWSPKTDIHCTLDGTTKSYCTPERYPPAMSRLFEGDGGGKFRDVTEAVGMGGEAIDKTLGAAALDVDGDGRVDLAVANDTQPNRLWKNLALGEDGKPHFEDVGMASGMGVDENGRARGAMGMSWAQIDDQGAWSLAIGNFSNEMMSLYSTRDGEFFTDDAIPSGLGPATLLPLTFGVAWADFDADGHLDLAIANGHVEPTIQAVQSNVAYQQAAMIFKGLGGGKLAAVPAEESGDLAQPVVGRGLASGDLDGDGDVDLAMTVNGGPPRLLLNRSESGARAVRLRLVGSGKNTDAVGAQLKITLGSRTEKRAVVAGDSYLSTSDRSLVIGLGDAPKIDRIEVRWPGGQTSEAKELAAGKSYVLTEGAGLAEGR